MKTWDISLTSLSQTLQRQVFWSHSSCPAQQKRPRLKSLKRYSKSHQGFNYKSGYILNMQNLSLNPLEHIWGMKMCTGQSPAPVIRSSNPFAYVGHVCVPAHVCSCTSMCQSSQMLQNLCRRAVPTSGFQDHCRQRHLPVFTCLHARVPCVRGNWFPNLAGGQLLEWDKDSPSAFVD